MSLVLDSNIYVYAFEIEASNAQITAQRIVEWHLRGKGMVPRQVIGEVLNVAHRRRKLSVEVMRDWADDIERRCEVIGTDTATLLEASTLAERYQLQFWDAVICTVARQQGASVLFSEDMHDGLRLGAMTIVNPFAPDNADLVEEILR